MNAPATFPPIRIRWTAARKAALINAVASGETRFSEAHRIYGLSLAEFMVWCDTMRKRGKAGLTVTKRVAARVALTEAIGETVETMLSVLDDIQGDVDLEETGAEDGFMAHGPGRGAGCEIADTGLADLGALREDDEDDDPAEDDLEDRCSGGDDHMIAGPVIDRGWWERHEAHTGQGVGDDGDAEPQYEAVSMDRLVPTNAS